MPLRSNQIRATKSAGNEWGLPLKKCQRQGGSAFSTLAGVAKSDFVVKSDEMKLYSDSDTDTGNTVERYFVVIVDSRFILRSPTRLTFFF